MRFSEFEQILFRDFFDPEYNQGSNKFDTLTFSWYDNRVDDPKRICVWESVWNYLIDNDIPKYIEYYKSMISDPELFREQEIPKEIASNINRNLGIFNKKSPTKKVEGQSWYTITPYERLPFNEGEVMRMRQFCEKFFNNNKLFKSAHFCVECGKHEKYPNLHIHALCHFKKDGGKNFSRILHTAWKKTYPQEKYNIKYKEWNSKKNKPNVGVLRVPCNTEQIINDKREYMNNGSKGSHENFKDLGIQGKFSF